MADLWEDVEAERTDLADLLATLTPEEWDVRSLCPEWRVRDVVGHLVMGSGKLPIVKTTVGFVKAGFNLDRMLGAAAIEFGDRPTDELLAQFREQASSHVRPPMTTSEDLLADVTVHAQDIRRPLGKVRTIPPERLRVVLGLTIGAKLTGSKRRAAGLRFVATDVDWSTGDGPLVEGPGEALLMAIAGRPVALDECSGDGVGILRDR